MAPCFYMSHDPMLLQHIFVAFKKEQTATQGEVNSCT